MSEIALGDHAKTDYGKPIIENKDERIQDLKSKNIKLQKKILALKEELGRKQEFLDLHEIDELGNTPDRLINCCFPNCGCDGARNCMAENGANGASLTLNLDRRRRE